MKMKIVTIAVMVVVAVLMVASVAQAASSTTTAIIKDAQDNGHLDGNYTAAQVQAALNFVKGDPSLQQYSNVEGVLEDYLASLPAPEAQTGGLMFTGGSTVVIFAFGLALMGGGLVLRRRHA